METSKLITTRRAGQSRVAMIDGRKVFRKEYPSFLERGRCLELEFKMFEHFKYSMPSTSYINHHISPEARAEKEERTIQKWTKAGINAPKIISREGSAILFEFMEGQSIDDLLATPELQTGHFDGFLDSFHEIRARAKKSNDPDMLHSDPHAGNFFYDAEKCQIIPLDPGIVPKESMLFQELDDRLNLFSLLKLFHLRTGNKNIAGYLNQAVGRLNSDEKERISKINRFPLTAWTYFNIHNISTKLLKQFNHGANRLSVYYSLKTVHRVGEALRQY